MTNPAKTPRPEMYIRKDTRGAWKADASVKLGNGYLLRFNTSKRLNGQLMTSASVCRLEDGFETHRVHQDYYRNLVSEKVRVTDKTVEQQMTTTLINFLDTVMADVRAQYGDEFTKQEEPQGA